MISAFNAIYYCRSVSTCEYKKAVLSQGEPRDAAVNFDTHQFYNGIVRFPSTARLYCGLCLQIAVTRSLAVAVIADRTVYMQYDGLKTHYCIRNFCFNAIHCVRSVSNCK